MMKLICFPYAGGSAMIYARWKYLVDSSIEIVPFELPGRGIRFGEKLCDNMPLLVEDAYQNLKDIFEKDHYMLYGHSMGSWIVYYLTMMIQKNRNRLPHALFLSGREAPHVRKKKSVSYLMEKEEFLNKIFILGGTPKELLENKKMQDVFIPVLKNDFKVIENCEMEEPTSKFDCDITVFNGMQDEVTQEDVMGWKQYTNKEFKFYQYDGDHFFINHYAKHMLDIVSKQARYGKPVA